MVKNLTVALITIAKGIKVAQVVAVNVEPQVEFALGTLEKLDEMQGIQQTSMLVEWRKEALFQQLDLSGLVEWSIKTKLLSMSYWLNIMISFPWRLEH